MARRAPHLADHQETGTLSVQPRLLDLRQAARYLGVSFWTARDWALQELFPVVRLPALRPKEGARRRPSLRRVLVDIRDLDAFIEGLKHADELQSPAPAESAALTDANPATVPDVCPRGGRR